MIRLILVLGLLVFSQGCALLISGTTEEICIESAPSGQVVDVDGTEYEMPVTLYLKRKIEHILLFPNGCRVIIRRGYNPVALLSSLWIVVGLLPGVVPMCIDGITGADKNLEPDHLLYREGKVIDCETGKILSRRLSSSHIEKTSSPTEEEIKKLRRWKWAVMLEEHPNYHIYARPDLIKKRKYLEYILRQLRLKVKKSAKSDPLAVYFFNDPKYIPKHFVRTLFSTMERKFWVCLFVNGSFLFI